MGPLLGEEAAAVGEVVEQGPVVGAEPGEERLVVGRDQHPDRVELEQPEPAHRGQQVAGPGPGRPGRGEPLRGQRHAAGLVEREVGAGHAG